jgi:hypothetical protein
MFQIPGTGGRGRSSRFSCCFWNSVRPARPKPDGISSEYIAELMSRTVDVEE